MNNKETPEEVLARLGEPSEGRYGSWHKELVEALRTALQQRRAAESDFNFVKSQLDLALKVIKIAEEIDKTALIYNYDIGHISRKELQALHESLESFNTVIK